MLRNLWIFCPTFRSRIARHFFTNRLLCPITYKSSYVIHTVSYYMNMFYPLGFLYSFIRSFKNLTFELVPISITLICHITSHHCHYTSST